MLPAKMRRIRMMRNVWFFKPFAPYVGCGNNPESIGTASLPGKIARGNAIAPGRASCGKK
jgi:hypothetical protein